MDMDSAIRCQDAETSQESRHRFGALPSEVLTEILKYVYWRDLLTAREVIIASISM